MPLHNRHPPLLLLLLLLLLPSSLPLSAPIAVSGATGRVGSLVVSSLLASNATVLALVRDPKRVSSQPWANHPSLTVLQADLLRPLPAPVLEALPRVSSLIYCASGFTSASGTSARSRLSRLLRVALRPASSVDAAAVEKLAVAAGPGAHVVMCSSAGVTRPGWSEEKKLRLAGCADIPIVRLNPFKILSLKLSAEDALRALPCRSTVVRPAGLSDAHPSGSRPVLSQGDVAVGRISRADLAGVLVACARAPGACEGKTFEVLTVPGLPAPAALAPQLAALSREPPGEEAVAASYRLLQQLVPGKALAPERLALGQTYEKLDGGEGGRFGERGRENTGMAISER